MAYHYEGPTLLPCPFCGSRIQTIQPTRDAPYKFFITCVCCAQMGSDTDADHAFFEEELATAWNTRASATPSTQQASVEPARHGLRGILQRLLG